MEDSLKFTLWVVLFIIFSALIYDVKQASRYKGEIKIALNNATKAASMQIDRDPVKIGQGIFDIDEEASKEVFRNYLSDNLSNGKDDLFVHVVDYRAINTHSSIDKPIDYLNSVNGKTYKISHPTFVAVLKYTYKGIFINRTIEINNLSGTRLRSDIN